MADDPLDQYRDPYGPRTGPGAVFRGSPREVPRRAPVPTLAGPDVRTGAPDLPEPSPTPSELLARAGLQRLGFAPGPRTDFIASFAPYTPMAGYDAGRVIGEGINEGSLMTGLGGVGMATLAALPFGARAPVRIPNPIRAYHGSPHVIGPEGFSMDRIGTGEGAQAYGHGLYFAESEPVARNYRNQLSQGWEYGGARIGPHSDLGRQLEFLNSGVNRNEPLEVIIPRRVQQLREHADFTDRQGGYGNMYRHAADRIEALDPSQLRRSGHMYEVNIHARPEQFLDWDRPLGGQSDAVRQQLGLETMPQRPSMQEVFATRRGTPERDALERRADNLNADQWRAIGFDPPPQFPSRVDPYFPGEVTGEHFARLLGGGERAAERLAEAGIPGIRYLDQGSRTAGQGTSNYVLFDPTLAEIIRRYGLAGPVAGGAAAASLMGDREQ